MVSGWRASRMGQINELSKTSDILVQASQTLIPWWSVSNDENILKTQTEETPNLAYRLFPLTEITVNNECEDIPKFINERFQTILSAAYTADISVAIIINSKNGKTGVYLGFKKEDSSENDSELFQAIINGVLPGKKIQLKETISISSLVEGFSHGGMVTGVPILKKDDEKLRFNISSVVRSLYGKDYTLVIISKPVSEENKQQSLMELLNLRDELHSLAKMTVGKESGTGSSNSASNTESLQPHIGRTLCNTVFGTKESKNVSGSEETTKTKEEQHSSVMSTIKCRIKPA